jgi:hypothetical protein
VVLFFCLLEQAVPFVILAAADVSTPTSNDPKRMLVTKAALAFFIINHSLSTPVNYHHLMGKFSARLSHTPNFRGGGVEIGK